VRTLNPVGEYRFILPAPELRRYLSSYYFFEIETPDGSVLDDFLHPEWASARYVMEGAAQACFAPGVHIPVPTASMTGPTGRATHILCQRVRLAGIGILPLGWYKFAAVDAARFANRNVELSLDPAFSVFAEIGREIAGLDDPSAIAAIMDRHLLAALTPQNEREIEIECVHSALTDPEIIDVAQLSGRTELSVQSLERLCRRVFGFPPKRLLRRQRFLRSLAPRLLDASLKWANVLDGSYHDQAHFSRDFSDFMGLSARDYLKMPRPISKAAIRARQQALGQPLQVLQGPAPNHG